MMRWLILGICGVVALGLVGGLISEFSSGSQHTAQSATPSGPQRCSQADARLVSDNLAPLMAKWSDEYQLAKSAPRISLVSVISQMQDTRRAYAAAHYPSCYVTAHADYLASMDDTIAGFTAFMGQKDNATVQTDLQKAQQELDAGSAASDAVKPK